MTDRTGPLEGRVALVTGCGRENGIGFAVAARLAAQGAAVAMTDVRRSGVGNAGESEESLERGPGLDGLAQRLRDGGAEAIDLYGDVSEPGVAEDMVRATIAGLGRVDILVNNAAAPQGDDRRPIEDVPDSAFDLLVGVNLYGVFQMCRAVVPSMRAHGHGRIVNVASMYGRRGFPNNAVYSMTKAGVIGFTQSTAVELAPFGITVNAVCPGFIRTSRVESGMRRRSATSEGEYLDAVGGVPAGRTGSPGDIAAVVASLAADDAGYVTAQSIAVDGGKLGF
jgi:3-oxoacyl-[acyl-carrier protein] reductase